MDTYRLMDTSVQMELLDSYAKTMGLKASVNEAYLKYSNVLHELETIKSEEFSDAELEFLTAQLDEIENANVQENELDALKIRFMRQPAGIKIQRIFRLVYMKLIKKTER